MHLRRPGEVVVEQLDLEFGDELVDRQFLGLAGDQHGGEMAGVEEAHL